jgi:predicted transposase YdaD
MPISYDVETDYLYKKGTAIGIEKGMEKKNIDVICQLRQEGSSIEFIAKIVRLSLEQVREILDNLKIK